MRFSICPTLQISHARPAGEPSLLKYGAMLSGSIIDDLGEIKGVALWLTGWAPFYVFIYHVWRSFLFRLIFGCMQHSSSTRASVNLVCAEIASVLRNSNFPSFFDWQRNS